MKILRFPLDSQTLRIVFKIRDEINSELIYSLRIKGSQFVPKVFDEGSYSIKILYKGQEKELTGIKAVPQMNSDSLNIRFDYY